MNPIARAFIERQLRYLEANQHRLTIDADTHITNLAGLTGDLLRRHESVEDYYHGRPISAEDVIREMDMADVDAALIWQNPATTVYAADPELNAESLLAANRYVRDSAHRYPERFIPAGWTDPKACGLANALRLAEVFVREFGFAIVKMNPAQNAYPIDSPDVLAVVDRIVSLGAIPAFHFGSDTPYTPAEGLERVAQRHPDHPVLAVHMGGGGAAYGAAESLYQEARRLGLRRPNIRFILSAKRDTHMESDLIAYQLAGEPFCYNLFCGSDAPFGRVAWSFGGFRAIFKGLIQGANHTDPRVRNKTGLFTPAAAQDYLGGNFARLATEGYRRVLGVSQ